MSPFDAKAAMDTPCKGRCQGMSRAPGKGRANSVGARVRGLDRRTVPLYVCLPLSVGQGKIVHAILRQVE